MSVITWQNETFRGRGGHLLHCIAKGRSVVGISAFFRHTLTKVRLHISVRLTSVFISAPSFWTFYSAQHQCHVSHSGSLMKSDWFFLVFQTGVDPQPSFGNHLLDFVGANMNPPPLFFGNYLAFFLSPKYGKYPQKYTKGICGDASRTKLCWMSILNEDSSCFDVLCKINVEGVFFHWSVDARFLIEASVTVPCNGCHSHVGRNLGH